MLLCFFPSVCYIGYCACKRFGKLKSLSSAPLGASKVPETPPQ